MRPATPADLDALTALWRSAGRAGAIDAVPGGAWLDGLLSGLDWESRTRVVEGAGGPEAALLVIERRTLGATIARLEFAGDRRHQPALLEWGVRLARAGGANAAQVWRGRGTGPGLAELGFRVVRPFWRMDRRSLDDLAEPALPDGYRVVTDRDREPDVAAWVTTYNLAFAEHWQHSPKEVDQLAARRRRPDHVPGLQLLAVAPDGRPAAVLISALESYPEDRRAQPVGLIAIVGTLPGHRRRGLAAGLLADALHRLRDAGARSASLYVDGLNATHAAAVYRRAGFEVAYEFEVWELALTA